MSLGTLRHSVPVVQDLEPRRLLSGSFSSITAHGTLIITGTPDSDVIDIQGVIHNKIEVTLNAVTIKYPAAQVRRINVDAGAGDDQMVIAAPRPVTVFGGDGNDSMTLGVSTAIVDCGAGNDGVDVVNGVATVTGDGGNDQLQMYSGSGWLSGGNGKDTLIGSVQDCTLIGGNGNDHIDPGFQDDTIDGDAGSDTVDYSDYSTIAPITAEIDIDNNTGVATGHGGDSSETDSYTSIETILGGHGNDTLTIDAGNESLLANYALIGGSGNDSLNWRDRGAHNSQITSATLDGGDGNDTLIGNGGPVTLIGGVGNNSIHA